MPERIFKKARRTAAYRRLFLTETGALSPDAAIVLDDLYEFTRFFKDVPLDPQTLAAMEGSRKTVRRIVDSLKLTGAERKRTINEGVFDDE